MKKLLVLLTVLGLLLTCTGCGNYLQVAAQIAQEAATVLQPDSPEAARYLNEAASDLNQLYGLIEAIKKAKTATDKQAIALRAQALVKAATGHLTQTLTALHVQNPATVHQVQIAVGIVNAALVILVNNLPAGSAPQAQTALAARRDLPLSTGKSARDFEKEWQAAKAGK